MSQTRRISKIAAAIAAGMLALVCAVPTTAAATAPTSSGVEQAISHANPTGGGGWCC